MDVRADGEVARHTHWQAAFRAGAYTPDQTDRYVRKIKAKIAKGLALKTVETR